MVDKKSVEPVQVSVKAVEDSDNSVVIGSFFNGVEIPTDTSFELYHHKKRNLDLILHGENENLEYIGETTDFEANQQYCIGVYDPSSNSIELLKTHLIPSKIISKSARGKKIPKVKQLNVQRNMQRNALGEEFGTKRAKKAISDLERNRIDSTKLESDQIEIVDSINVNTSKLPTKSQMNATMNENRTIPEFNIDATSVDDIYPLENIIPSNILSSIRVDAMLEIIQDSKAQLDCLPYTNSRYLLQKLSSLASTTTLSKSSKKIQLQLIYYLSALLGMYANRRQRSKATLLDSFQQPPPIPLLDYMISNFTLKKTSTYFQIDPKNEDKLLCYILCLILRLDDFIIPLAPLSQELSVKSPKLIQLFRSLGCTVKNATLKQLDSMDVSREGNSNYKMAQLKVPFKAPEIARRSGGPSR
ncbi:hypothetical protein CANARDRAFT_196862 [[Candida] arabinofermentans NRRL YB-2248]|uniref:DNA-directed RNA polymerase I subunit RPA49 n=1 Tax=[Candida] arabinofermentans NRRL YB-2248 TaxID=983967 RepID=A0A1E4T319_9ASCO|nr:hypothetical protein CANARDRAFT_196862 [[Candida] arabinofermentans NRRL YB-2248]